MTQNKQVELKNCPFCKSDNCYIDKEEFERDGVQPYTYTPRCGECYACIESFTNEESAIKAWNNRPIEKQQQEVIEDMRGALKFYKEKWVNISNRTVPSDRLKKDKGDLAKDILEKHKEK